MRVSFIFLSIILLAASTMYLLLPELDYDDGWKIYFHNQNLLVNSKERSLGMFKNETLEMLMILELISKKHPFAITRYGDGEYFIMKGKQIKKHSQAYKKDHWYWDKDEIGVMGGMMKQTLKAPKGVYIYGLPPQVRWQKFKDEMLNFSGNSIEPRFLTTSMIFRGETFDLFNFTFLTPVLSGASISNPIVFVINHKYRRYEERLRKIVADIFYVPDNGPNYFEIEDNRIQFMNEISRFCKKHSDSTFLIAAGPMSEIIIYNMWECNSSNQYIDIGRTLSQSLDFFLENR